MRKGSFYDNDGFKIDEEYLKIKQIIEKKQSNKQKQQRWQKILPMIQDMRINHSRQLILEIRKGVPDSIRNDVWSKLIFPPYQPYSKFEGKSQLKQISLDLQRTMPHNKKLKNLLQSLQKVLNALALALPEMGYCQGLNFIVASLLLKVTQEQAYNIAHHILSFRGQQRLLKNLDIIHKKSFVLEKLLEKRHPQLCERLRYYEVLTLAYAAPWFITLYSGVLPPNYVFRILQMYFVEGYKILYRVGLQIMKQKKKRLKSLDSFEDILGELKNFTQFTIINEDDFFNSMFKIELSKKQIQQYQEYYDQQQKKNKINENFN